MLLSLAPDSGRRVEGTGSQHAYLDAVAAAGFGAVSLGIGQVADLAADGAKPLEALAERGLRCADVISLAISRDVDACVANAERLAGAVEALGAEHVLTIYMTRLRPESIDLTRRCADVVKSAGARLALEFVPGGTIGSIDETVALADELGADRAGVMIDTWHFFRGASTWEQLESVPLDRISYVQFDDALPAVSEDVMGESMNRRTWPGMGEFELDRFATTLRERGWSGLVSVEVLGDHLRDLGHDEYADQAYRSTAPYWLD